MFAAERGIHGTLGFPLDPLLDNNVAPQNYMLRIVLQCTTLLPPSPATLVSYQMLNKLRESIHIGNDFANMVCLSELVGGAATRTNFLSKKWQGEGASSLLLL